MNNHKEIELNLDIFSNSYYHCSFNLKGEFIFCSDVLNRHGTYHKIIWIYSTQTKNNKWTCKRIYKIPNDSELLDISKYDSEKIYLFSNNNFYEWNILTEKIIKLFGNETYKEEYEVIRSILFKFYILL